MNYFSLDYILPMVNRVHLSNVECVLQGIKIYVHRENKYLLKKFSNQWTPFIWKGITFTSLHQILWFL
jgi:hypothetical protein